MFIHSLGQIVSIVGEFWGQTTLSVYIFFWIWGAIYSIIFMGLSLEVHRIRNESK